MFQLRNGNLHLAVLRILNQLELILVQKRLASANFNKLILLPFRYKLMLPRKAKCLFVGFSKGDLAIWTEGLLSQARAWPCIIDVYSRKYRIVHCSPILPPLSILYFKGTFWFTIKESIATFFFFPPTIEIKEEGCREIVSDHSTRVIMCFTPQLPQSVSIILIP